MGVWTGPSENGLWRPGFGTPLGITGFRLRPLSPCAPSCDGDIIWSKSGFPSVIGMKDGALKEGKGVPWVRLSCPPLLVVGVSRLESWRSCTGWKLSALPACSSVGMRCTQPLAVVVSAGSTGLVLEMLCASVCETTFFSQRLAHRAISHSYLGKCSLSF